MNIGVLHRSGLWLWPAFLLYLGCPRVVAPPQVLVPIDTGPYGPSLTQVQGDEGPIDFQQAPAACASCHKEQTRDWQQSMHAFSSFNNPFYRFNFDNYVDEKGFDKGPFCAGCHDPAPLLSGELKQKMQPQSINAHVGINCISCHLTQHADFDGNGSYTLNAASLLLPQGENPQKLNAHRAQMASPKQLGNALCVSCHRGFLSQETGHDIFIPALEDWVPFRHSGYNQQKGTRVDEPAQAHQCIDCHMPLKTLPNGQTVHDHRFVGGHTAFSHMAQLDVQHQKNKTLLQNGAKLFVPIVGFDQKKGQTFEESLQWQEANNIFFDVVIFNANTGHHFPGGAKDIKDTWLEVRITDENDNLVAHSGMAHEKEAHDLDAHRLGVVQIDEKGQPVLEHRVAHFRTAAFDHTIGPRDARVIRYALDLRQYPNAKGKSLTARVRLRYRRLLPSFYETSCEASQTERGQAFLAATQKYNGVTLNPCSPQPVIDLHETVFSWITPDAPIQRVVSPQALWAHGLGMLHALNEKVFLARHSFDLAKATATRFNQLAQWESRLAWAQATVSGKQGRSDEAISLFDAELKKNKNHPALLMGAAQAHIRTWRFKEAIPYLEKAFRQAPQDARIAVDLARSYAANRQYPRALQTAQAGLRFAPRNPHLLRLQAISLERTHKNSDAARQARQAFLKYKRDELAPAIQGRCQDQNPFCKRERLGFHTHWLTAPKN